MRIWLAVGILACAGQTLSSEGPPYPLRNKVGDAHVIVVGKLTTITHHRFSLVFHGYIEEHEIGRCDAAEHEYFYDTGKLAVERVLKGSVDPEHTHVAFCSGYRVVPADHKCRGMQCPQELMFHEGQEGIWVLRKDQYLGLGFLGAKYDAVIPIDSLEAVLQYLDNE